MWLYSFDKLLMYTNNEMEIVFFWHFGSFSLGTKWIILVIKNYKDILNSLFVKYYFFVSIYILSILSIRYNLFSEVF